jgi:hypothetical protein
MEIQDQVRHEIQDEVRHPTDDEARHEIKSRTVAHMVEVVGSTPFEQEPFPHFIAHGIFPAEVYREMLASFPERSLYENFKPKKPKRFTLSKRLKGWRLWTGERGRFELTNASIDRLEGRQRSLWLGVRDALGAPEFKEAVFDRLREGLAFRARAGEDVAKLPAYPLPELFRETSGYKIKPHPDTPRKVVTMQIALPADGGRPDLGTQFYRRSLNPLHLVREPRGFKVAKQVPFLPNVAYAFVVLNTGKLKSWHGRTMIEGEVGERNTILNLWYTKPALANPDIVEQYYRAD